MQEHVGEELVHTAEVAYGESIPEYVYETTVEGEDYDQLMDIARECQHIAIRAGAEKVSAYIKVVYRPEGEILTIDRKITKHAQV